METIFGEMGVNKQYNHGIVMLFYVTYIAVFCNETVGWFLVFNVVAFCCVSIYIYITIRSIHTKVDSWIYMYS